MYVSPGEMRTAGEVYARTPKTMVFDVFADRLSREWDEAPAEQSTPVQQIPASSKAKSKTVAKGKQKGGKQSVGKRAAGVKCQVAPKRQRPQAAVPCSEQETNPKEQKMGLVSSRIPATMKQPATIPVSSTAAAARDTSDSRTRGRGQACGLNPNTTVSNASGEVMSENLLQQEEHANNRDLDGRGCKTPQTSPSTPVVSKVYLTGERFVDVISEPVEVVSPKRVTSTDSQNPVKGRDAEQDIDGRERAVSGMDVEQYQSRPLEETNTDDSGQTRSMPTREVPEGSAETGLNILPRPQRESKAGPSLSSADHTMSSSGHAPDPMTVDEENQTQLSLEDEIPEGPNLRTLKNGGIPNADVTRVVRLPPEFGSLQVRFRITAGDRSSSLTPGSDTASDSSKLKASIPLPSQDCHSNVMEAQGPQSQLEQRLDAVEQSLRLLQRLEKAHTLLGRLPSPCDLHALEIAQGQAPKSEQEDGMRSPRGASTAGRRLDDSGQRSGDASRGSSMRHLSASSSGRLKQKILHANRSQLAQPMPDVTNAPPPQGDDSESAGQREPLKSVTSARGSLPRDAATRTMQGQSTWGSLPGRLFTGATQGPSSCLVLQIPPTSGAQIGVSSVPAIAPAYYLPRVSVEPPPACSPTSSSPSQARPTAPLLAVASLPNKETIAGSQPLAAGDVVIPSSIAGPLLGHCPGGGDRTPQQVRGTPQTLELWSSQPLSTPDDVVDGADVQRASNALRCTETEGNVPQCRSAGDSGYPGLECSDGRNMGERNGFLEGESHRGGRRGLETSQCAMDAATGTE